MGVMKKGPQWAPWGVNRRLAFLLSLRLIGERTVLLAVPVTR